VKDEQGDEILIPMCHGSAVHGSFACTCTVPDSRIEAAERGRREAELYVEKLLDRAHERAERLNQMFRLNTKLQAEIIRLEKLQSN
jgi:hypothetical protein